MNYETLYETLLCEIEDSVATVTLNRPKVLHALNTQVFDELEQVFLSLKADLAVRVILLTGAGEKAFAAGADINELRAADAAAGEAKALRGQSVFRLIETCGKPVIALVNGFALGGGCELAMACTMRLASETARLGQPEVAEHEELVEAHALARNHQPARARGREGHDQDRGGPARHVALGGWRRHGEEGHRERRAYSSQQADELARGRQIRPGMGAFTPREEVDQSLASGRPSPVPKGHTQVIVRTPSVLDHRLPKTGRCRCAEIRR